MRRLRPSAMIRGRDVEVGRDLEGAREIVRGAHRQDAERQAGLDHAERGGVQGAVAAADDDAVHLPGMLRRCSGDRSSRAPHSTMQRLDPMGLAGARLRRSSLAAPLRLLALTIRRARLVAMGLDVEQPARRLGTASKRPGFTGASALTVGGLQTIAIGTRDR